MVRSCRAWSFPSWRRFGRKRRVRLRLSEIVGIYTSAVELLERQAQLAQLASAVERAADGSGSVVLVRGDAGIGKTTLVRHFVNWQTAGADVRWGCCDDLLTPHPFGPLWEVAASELDLLAALEANNRPLVFRSVLEFISGIDRPAVLVIEDAHWADEATLDLIKHVGRRIGERRGVLIVTCRDVGMSGGNELSAVVGDLPNEVVVRVSLPTLTEGAVRELARSSGQAGAGLLEQSGGNPLFVTELLRHPDVGVPASIRELTLSRMSRLGLEARRLLSLVAVVPGQMDRTLVETCAGREIEGLDECEAHGLIESSPMALAFRHEVVRRAVEVSLSAGERTRSNRVVLDALVALGAEPTRLVHHARWAHDAAAVIRYAPFAAAKAASLDSHRQAVEHFRLLEPYVDALPSADRAQICLAWAREELIVGEAARSVHCAVRGVAALREFGDANALSRALVQLSHAQWFHLDVAAAEAAATEAVEVLDGTPELSRELGRAQSECAGLASMACRTDEAIALANQAIASAEIVGDRASVAHALCSKGAALSMVDYVAGCELMEASLDIAHQDGYGYQSLRACVTLADVALLDCDLQRAQRYIQAGYAIALDRERDSFRHDFDVLSAHHHLLAGRFDESATLVDAAIVDAGPHYLPTLYRLLACLQSMRGMAEAGDTFVLAAVEAARTQKPQHLLLVGAARAEHAWLTQDMAAIGAETDEAYEWAVSLGHRWIAGALALWLWKAGRLDGTPNICAEPYRLQLSGRWREAAETWAGLGLPYHRAVALADGDNEAKLVALDTLDRLGTRPLAAQLRKELREAGVQQIPNPPRAATVAAGGLTARQLEVLHLVSEGYSNKQIAQQLFISARTVEHHLSAILTALEVTSRTDAVAAGHARGLLTSRPADYGAAGVGTGNDRSASY